MLGPLMFLIYINDITEDISSQLRLFADDCLLYLPIKSEQDSILLLRDSDTFVSVTKLHYYGIYGPPLHDWIKVWLTRRYQKVANY